MPRSFRFRFEGPALPEAESFEFEIPDEEWALLSEFIEIAESTFANSDALSSLHVQIVLKGDLEKGRIAYETTLPSDDAIAVLLHRLRPFVLDRERTFFPRMCNILCRYVTVDEFREKIKEQKQLFLGTDFQSQVKIDVNGETVNSDTMLSKWLNAHQFHRDRDKQQELESLRDWFPDDYVKGLFVSMVIDKAKAILNLAKFVRWMDEGGTSSFRFLASDD